MTNLDSILKNGDITLPTKVRLVKGMVFPVVTYGCENWTIKKAAAAAAAKLLQSCLTLCDPKDGSPPGSPSLGFSRQEHWSGLPFPSPMHEVKSESEVAQSCPTLSDPTDCSLPGSSIHGIFQARVLEWGITPSKSYHFNHCFLPHFIPQSTFYKPLFQYLQ